jgi:hypothetical protein
MGMGEREAERAGLSKRAWGVGKERKVLKKGRSYLFHFAYTSSARNTGNKIKSVDGQSQLETLTPLSPIYTLPRCHLPHTCLPRWILRSTQSSAEDALIRDVERLDLVASGQQLNNSPCHTTWGTRPLGKRKKFQPPPKFRGLPTSASCLGGPHCVAARYLM